jgi:hypothetical protein
MKKLLSSVLITLGLGGAAVTTEASTRLETAIASITEETIEKTESPEKEAKLEPEEKTYRWVGKNFSADETRILNFFQDYGIEDKMALAVLLGNIKQESRITPNICEGGARVPYEKCHRGGYGLIQWTTSFRYWGLGNHAKTIGSNPSELDTQLSYLVTEVEWKEALWRFQTPNESLSFYMKGAYRWLGWGIYGNRGHYSQQYHNNLVPS